MFSFSNSNSCSVHNIKKYVAVVWYFSTLITIYALAEMFVNVRVKESTSKICEL